MTRTIFKLDLHIFEETKNLPLQDDEEAIHSEVHDEEILIEASYEECKKLFDLIRNMHSH